MGFFTDRKIAEIEAENEVLDVELERASKKAQMKLLKKQLGEKDLKQQIKDGMITVVKSARKLKVDRDTAEGLYGIRGYSHLRRYTDPSMRS